VHKINQKVNRDGKKLMTLKTETIRPLSHEEMAAAQGGTVIVSLISLASLVTILTEEC